MKHLYVHFESKLVGRLEEDTDGILYFSYDPQWFKETNAFPLSLALALREEPYRGRLATSFFENLLPEGERRKQIERVAGLPAGDDAAFLERFGEDCAGALSVSLNKIHSAPQSKPSEILLPFETIEQAIREGKPIHTVLDPNGELPAFSLAGAQAKFPCLLKDGQVKLASTREPSTHIIKLPIQAGSKHLDSVENEYICMRLAELCHLPVPKVMILGLNISLLSIERFDRKVDAQGVHRIHTQDICQALGKPSKEKYEKHGGPSFADCYRIIQDHSFKGAEDILALLDWVGFNIAIGNNDSHAKNISLKLTEHGISLAPFYDLVSTALYPQYNAAFAFKIGEITSWDKINYEKVEGFAKKLGLRASFVISRWLPLLEKIEMAMESMGQEFENKQSLSKTMRKIRKEASMRIKTLRRNLA